MAGGKRPRHPPEPSGRLSEAEIAVHWGEEEYLPPPPGLAATANLRDPAVERRFALERFPDCFREYAELLDWERPWETVLDAGRPPFYRWFVGGELNASVNCVDRHVAEHGDRTAIVFVPEPEGEAIERITYRELGRRVDELASVLAGEFGLRRGDRVTVHLPMIPELAVTMLACARLGVVHSVVFGGFSGEAAGHRAADCASRLFVTADGYWRAGRAVDHLAQLGPALDAAAGEDHPLERVLVGRRSRERRFSEVPLVPGRDVAADEALGRNAGRRAGPVAMPSEAPLFLMYTSGTTGRPKGCQHATGGYLAYAAGTARGILDLHPEDVYWCLADIGWITGHSYIVYGPLALGATTVLYEGVPAHPDAGRPWRVAERLGVSVFHTSPTAIRQLRRLGPEEPRRHHHRFRVLATVGEPIEPEAWRWYFREVGHGAAAVVDTWWQTETGGILCSTKPALDRMKPGSCGPGAPGIHPFVLDEDGREIPPGAGRAGNLCLRNPWPGLMQTIWGDPERFVRQYFRKYNRDPESRDWRDWPYFAGDAALIAADGYVRVLGRVDDVINVAGHRLGTKEIESACLTVPEVVEAAAVPVADELKGRLPDVYVAVRPGTTLEAREVEERVVRAIETVIGKIARPRRVWVVPDMPKTRSGKILRRVLAGLSNRRDTGDVTTLANPEVVAQIRAQVEQDAPPEP
ncbi:MAG TPA: acetate--CoA ligase [Thermoplasmata archaeon]|nr:acetate--CoA ligase [Thermoplasmata archaeon]